MPSTKRTPERKSRSGSYVPNDLRGTVRVEVRCSPELAARVRSCSRATGLSLATILSRGVDAIDGPAPRPLTPAEEERAYRADREYDRMRDDDIREGR